MGNRRIFLAFLSIHLVQCQLQACWRADNSSSEDFPCNPEAKVSACCIGGWICETNLHCYFPDKGWNAVGTCTDRSFQDAACPYKLNLDGESQVTNTFNYTQNTTICDDGTICPFPGNQACCRNKLGRKEIQYHNNAIMPTAVNKLSSYYALAGYTIPTSTGAVETSSASTSTSSTSTASASSTPAVPVTQSTSLNPSVSTASASPTSSASTSAGLSNGAKAGIGVGVGLLVILVSGLVYYLVVRPRQRSSTMSEDDLRLKGQGGSLQSRQEMHGTPMRQELYHESRHELYDERGPRPELAT